MKTVSACVPASVAVAFSLAAGSAAAASQTRIAVDTVLSIEGDRAYGEYLAATCVACHAPAATADAIPSIAGMDLEVFVRAVLAYQTGERTHDAMRAHVAGLNARDVAALAAYFAALGESGR
jgi:cytochrome c553